MKLRRLIEERIKQGVSQRDLAVAMGVSQGTVQNILHTNTIPMTKTLKLAARYFQVPTASLLEEENDSTPTPPTTYPDDRQHYLDCVNRIFDHGTERQIDFVRSFLERECEMLGDSGSDHPKKRRKAPPEGSSHSAPLRGGKPKKQAM